MENQRVKEKCNLDGERNGNCCLEKEGLKQHFPVIHDLNISLQTCDVTPGKYLYLFKNYVWANDTHKY